MLRVSALLVLIAVGLAAARASAEEVKAVQVLVDGSSCADADSFFSRLSARTHLVRRARENETRTRTLRIRLLEARHHVLGELRMEDARGEALVRKLEGATCDDVIEALALTAAVALDPNLLLSVPDAPALSTDAAGSGDTPSAKSTGVAPPDKAAAPTASALRATDTSARQPPATSGSEKSRPAASAPAASRSKENPARATASRVEPQLQLGIASTAGFPLSSGPSLGLAFFGRWTPAARKSASVGLRPDLGVAVVYARNDVVRSPKAVEASLVGMRGSACPVAWEVSPITVKPCTSLMAGRLSATGDHANHPRSVEVLWLSASAGARIDVELGAGFALDVEVGVSAPLLRREFYVTAPGHVVDRTSTLSPEFALGVVRGF